MDKNKLKVLQSVNYKIQNCCSFCTHSRINEMRSIWGTCKKHTYKHLKHTGEEREMSINAYGTCENFERADGLDSLLGSFTQFERK
jgi:hypothetical protein